MRPIFHYILYSYQVLEEEDKIDIAEKKAEEAFTYTPVVQEGSGDVIISLRPCSAPDVADGIAPCRRRKDALLTLLKCNCSDLPFNVEVDSKKMRSCCQMSHFYLEGAWKRRKWRIEL
jgi:hypothetical protein